MVLSSFFSTLFALFVKIGVEHIYLPWILFLRFFVPLVFVSLFSLLKRSLLKEISFKDTGKHAIRSLAVVISQLSLLYYFTKGSLTNGVMLWNTAPMFVPIITYILFRQKTSAVVWFSLFVSFAGVLLVLKPTNDVFDPFIIFGFISGFSLSISQVLNGMHKETDTLMNNVFLFFFNASVLTGILLLCFLGIGGFHKEFLITSDHTMLYKGLIILFIGIGSAMNQVLRGVAFTFARPDALSPFIYLSVVFSAIIDYILHPGTIHGFLFILGIALILVGTLIPLVYTKQLP